MIFFIECAGCSCTTEAVERTDDLPFGWTKEYDDDNHIVFFCPACNEFERYEYEEEPGIWLRDSPLHFDDNVI